MRAMALLVALTALPASAQETVRPGDGLLPFDENRRIAEATDYPWSAIGRLNIARRGHCTAVLVAETRLLTAAHCLFDRRTGRFVEAEDLHFLAGYQRGDFLKHVRASDYHVADGFDPAIGRPTPHDWALIDLTEPAGRPLPVRRRDAGDLPAALVQAGYHTNRPHVLSVTHGCAGLGTQARLALHDCWIAGGDSGSPLLEQDEAGYALIALNIAIRQRPGQNEPIGLAIPSAQFWTAVTAR